ncbi:MAG TPA: HIT domain-containing protein [Candidatus Paceibacterota bacterium]|nr:HIT domain-containing protein [Candidatus Paceibacterota bacterium]
MENCIFCKIASGEVPTRKIHHEGDTIVSFFDINPQAPGHTLVVPVAHYHWFLDMPENESDQLFRTCKKIARELKKEYGTDCIKLRIDGKDVPHVHVHLIPQKL